MIENQVSELFPLKFEYQIIVLITIALGPNWSWIVYLYTCLCDFCIPLSSPSIFNFSSFHNSCQDAFKDNQSTWIFFSTFWSLFISRGDIDENELALAISLQGFFETIILIMFLHCYTYSMFTISWYNLLKIKERRENEWKNVWCKGMLVKRSSSLWGHFGFLYLCWFIEISSLIM